MKLRLVIALGLLASACGGASEINTAGPDTLNLLDASSTVVEAEPADDEPSELASTTTMAGTEPTSTEPTSTEPNSADPNIDSSTTTAVGTTTAPSTTSAPVTTTAAVNPYADFCQAAGEIQALGTSADFTDPEATAAYFEADVELWASAALVAPAAIATDTQTVATYVADFRDLLADNDFVLFAVFEEVSELEAASGSDLAEIRTEQFIYANCDATPPLPEQATAAFYGGLLDTVDDRTYLAELLASAEVFTLEGAQCFVNQATPDVMHPLVGAPATPNQEAALSSVLSSCQLSIGL